MKKQLLLLSGLLIGSPSLSAAMTVQKPRTQWEQYLVNRQLVEAATAGDTDRIKALLKEGVLRDTQEYESFPFEAIRAPYEIATSVLELLEDYFTLKEDTQATGQSNNTDKKDQAKLKKSLASFHRFLEQKRLNQQLIKAAKEGNAPFAKELIKKGASITFRDQKAWLSPFEWGAIQGHTEILNILLDALEDTIARDYQDSLYIEVAFQDFREANEARQFIVPLFQRDVRDLDEQMNCLEKIQHYCESSSLKHAKSLIEGIAENIKVNLSRDIIFTFFSAHNNSLRLSLQAIGAQQLTHAPHTRRLDKQEHLDRLLLFAAKTDDELVKALIDEGADVTTVDSMERTPLHIASYHENMRTASILIREGAPIDAKNGHGVTPLYVNGRPIGPGVAKLLLEAGATLEDNDRSMSYNDTRSREAITTHLEAGIRRFAPTQREARIALQNVAFLIYFFGIKLNLPSYVIYEIICFAIGEQDTPGQFNNLVRIRESLWSGRLQNQLGNLYLYKINGNKLRSLWEQTVRCVAKDPDEQLRLISRLGGYLEPFLANDVKRFVCLRMMNNVAEGKKILGNKFNADEILVDNFKLYYDHLDKYLQMSGFDEE